MSTVIRQPDFDNDDVDKPKKCLAQDKACLCLRRLTRIILLLFGAILTIYVCILSSDRYFKYWVQTTIDRTDVHVSMIPFPAITICPTQINFKSWETSKRENRIYKLFNLVQSVHWRTAANVQETERDLKEFEEFNNQSLHHIDSIFNYGYKCKDLFVRCTWRRKVVDCCSVLFRRLSFSSCYTFNSLHAVNPDPTWPWSVADYGIKSALNIKLNRYKNRKRLEAIGVIVQEPSELIGSSVTYTADDRIVLSLQPLHFTAEPGVRARPVNMRHCYFPGELAHSYSDCITFCNLNYMYEKCNCTYDLPMPVKVDLRREKPTRRCEVKDLPCLQSNGVSLFYMGNIIEESTDNIFNTTDCECFRSCTYTQYHSVTFTDRWNSLEGNDNYINIDVHFQEETLFSYRSTLYITILDLMVSYGGIAGLFLGISVLGAINAILNHISCCKKHKPKPVKPDHASKRI